MGRRAPPAAEFPRCRCCAARNLLGSSDPNRLPGGPQGPARTSCGRKSTPQMLCAALPRPAGPLWASRTSAAPGGCASAAATTRRAESSRLSTCAILNVVFITHYFS